MELADVKLAYKARKNKLTCENGIASNEIQQEMLVVLFHLKICVFHVVKQSYLVRNLIKF